MCGGRRGRVTQCELTCRPAMLYMATILRSGRERSGGWELGGSIGSEWRFKKRGCLSVCVLNEALDVIAGAGKLGLKQC